MDAEKWLKKGDDLSNHGRYQEAVKAYDRALSIDTDYVAAWNNMGLALDNLGKYTEAVNAFDTALIIDPDAAIVWSNKDSHSIMSASIKRL